MEKAVTDLRERFEQLATPLARPLYRLAVRLISDRDEAQDVVQETYLRAYRTFKNFKPGTNFKAWLFTILYSVAKNRYRKASRSKEGPSLSALEEVDAKELETEGFGSHLEVLRTLERQHLRREILAALERMPPDWRAIVVLVTVEGYGYEEVASILGCPVGTVASRLYRARRRLVRSLADRVDVSGAEGTAQP